MPTDRLITVKKSGNGLQYKSGGADAKFLDVKPNDRISWTSPDGQLTILFKSDQSPCETKRQTFAADKDEATPLRKLKSLRVVERPKKHFTYSVALLDDNDNLITEDPDIIINDPGGGSGGGGGSSPGTTTKGAAKTAKKAARKANPKKRSK